MDYFEGLICTLLEAEGYWVRRSFKVNLTKEEKRDIGKHSIPRPEIDVLAMKASTGEVLAIEAKSFLDSPGVKLEHLESEYTVPEGRYKLFTSEKYRSIVFSRLHKDLLQNDMIGVNCNIRLGLAVGNVYRKKTEPMREYMDSRNWFYWSPEDIKDKVTALAAQGYENDASIIAAKILMR